MRSDVLSLVAAMVAIIFLSACGGGDGGSGTIGSTSRVSFSVSDAPVDSADEVVIAFEQIELVVDEETSVLIDVDDGVNDYVQVNLLDFQGTDAKLLVTEESIPAGTYENLILHISDESGANYVIDNTGQVALKQPSNKLRLGGFEVTQDAVQSFTIEFDLRMSLVMRGNLGNNNGYILKPHGVTIVNNDSAVSLSGTVDPNLFDEGDCATQDGNMVYLYSGNGLDADLLIDLVDPEDETFTGEPVIPENSIVPVTSVEVAENGSYEFGFLSAGAYTAAYVCDGESDDSIEYNPEVVIPAAPTFASPGVKLVEVTLENGIAAVADFNF
ncbi:DUF4382 domain-containing protein [Vibrio sp. TRT 17S01]|uniref:DUF4382 domain-containing protein n=1 Tax=Vibrio sp. TRT 17S01 TaxID=3418505 RepID=UPI003CF573BD